MTKRTARESNPSLRAAGARAPIAVTGVGILTPLADDLAKLAAALNAGQASVVSDDRGGPAASRLREFDARRYANVRGMRIYARNTQLQICAAQLALADAGLARGAAGAREQEKDAREQTIDPCQFGLVSAGTFAHLETLLDYDRSLVSAGVQRTNPTWMPLALPSAPGALTALSFDAKAFAITLSDGGGSGLSALALGARMLAAGRAEACLVTAAFTECSELAQSALRAELLAPPERFRVFDRNSGGTAFGELAVAVVLENAAHAAARSKAALGFVRADASTFAAEPQALATALGRACDSALAAAHVSPSEIALASAGANGLVYQDSAEAHALLGVLGGASARVCVSAPKANLGESLDASGIVQSVVALQALRAGIAPPIVGLREPAVAGLRYLASASALDSGCALITSIAPSGACSALVLSGVP